MNRRHLIAAACGLAMLKATPVAARANGTITSELTGAVIDYSGVVGFEESKSDIWSNQEWFQMNSQSADAFIVVSFYESGLWTPEKRHQSFADLADNPTWRWEFLEGATNVDAGYMTVYSKPKERIKYLEFHAGAYPGYDVEVIFDFHSSNWDVAKVNLDQLLIDGSPALVLLEESDLEAVASLADDADTSANDDEVTDDGQPNGGRPAPAQSFDTDEDGR